MKLGKYTFISLRWKFASILFLFLGAFLVVDFFQGLTNQFVLKNLSFLQNKGFPQYVQTNELVSRFKNITVLFEDAGLTGEKILLDQVNKEYEQCRALLFSLKSSSNEMRILIAHLEENLIQYHHAGEKLTLLLLDQNAEENDSLYQENLTRLGKKVGELKSAIHLDLDSLLRDVNMSMNSTLIQSKKQMQTSLWGLILMSILMSFVMVALYVWFGKKIIQPIRTLSGLTAKVARGNYEHELSSPSISDDEIGELRQNFEKMRESLKNTTVSKTFLDGIIDSMAESLWVLSPETIVTRTNRAASDLMKLPPEKIIGKKLDHFFVKSSITALFETANFKADPTNQVTQETEVYIKDQTIPILLSLSALRNSNQEISGYVCLARDISKIKEVQSRLTQQKIELERSNAELEQFAYVASHDLQEPLRMVASYLQLLERKYREKLDDTAREFIQFAVDGSVRMKGLIKDLLAYSRVGTRAGESEWVQTNEVIQQVLQDLKPVIEESKAQITLQSLPEIFFYGRHLSQLFQNLIGNALKYRNTSLTPLIEIGVQEKEGHYLFWVKDNGIGIKPEYLEKIFVIFQRLHSREEYEGSGIGLAICKKIVERSGGNIWVNSQPGEGSTFYFTIPKKKK